MAWVGDHIFSYGQYCAGFTVNCPESGATVSGSAEIGPLLLRPHASWENILTTVMIAWRMLPGSSARCSFFHGVAQRVGARKLAGQAVGLLDTLLYALGTCVYGPLKDIWDWGAFAWRILLGRRLGQKFYLLSLAWHHVKQLYGMTEAVCLSAFRPTGRWRPIRGDTDAGSRAENQCRG